MDKGYEYLDKGQRLPLVAAHIFGRDAKMLPWAKCAWGQLSKNHNAVPYTYIEAVRNRRTAGKIRFQSSPFRRKSNKRVNE